MIVNDIDFRTVHKIAGQAAAAIMEVYSRNDFDIELKGDHSPLTAADKASHAVIVQGLRQAYPSIPILSEEGREIPYSQRSNWTRFWLVDPLDGTKEFIKRNGEFTVNIALVDHNRVVAGLVNVPAQNVTFLGALGAGAWKIKGSEPPKAIRVRQALAGEALTVVMSRSHPAPALAQYLESVPVADALPVGSSLKFCVVAEGKADLYPRLGPTMEWDTAAGHAVVEAAGGRVCQLNGAPLTYNKDNLLNPHFIVKGG